jgi:ABC-type oligopeptide transport system substrate-binding subunit
VDLLPISNPSAAFNLYDSAQADIIWDKEAVPAELLPTLRQRPDFHGFAYLGTYFLRINVTKNRSTTRESGKPSQLVIDKERIVQNLRKSGELIASHLVPPSTANYHAPHRPGLRSRAGPAPIEGSGL